MEMETHRELFRFVTQQNIQWRLLAAKISQTRLRAQQVLLMELMHPADFGLGIKSKGEATPPSLIL